MTNKRADPMIQLKNIYVRSRQEVPIINNFSLSVASGELVVLSGPSGSGKSTIIRLINGLAYMDEALVIEGTAEMNGQSIEAMASWERSERVGSVFQDPRSQFFTSVVGDELAFYCENFGMRPETIKKRVHQAAIEQKLMTLLDHRIMTLSSGEKQKVAIAAVRVARQTIYVLDEPSSNLNLAATLQLADLLGKWKAAGHTIVLAEHRLHYLSDLLDRMIYVRAGQAMRSFSKEELVMLPAEQLAESGLRQTRFIWRASNNRRTMPQNIHQVSINQLSINGWSVGETLLHDLTFSIRSGEVVMLTGSNGIGKTSLARVLCGLSGKSEGTIMIDGRPVPRRKRSQQIRYVMQEADYQLFGQSVWDELFIGIKEDDVQVPRAQQLLRELDLWALRDRHPSTLSGGEKQRVTLAAALMSAAPIIILDEPTSGLDWHSLEKAAECLKREAGKGRIFLVITHDYELISQAGTRLIHLRDRVISDDFLLDENSSARVLALLTQDEP
ncbi:ABC transporter ATP-binding protein [Sporolactobacillus shoreicorticis]|uniref:ABC transporter ATP-binding protein n=1 Tax=Sporolactobacillus shoreicorticis TaxID=1923877 RepID=A0ABW5S5I2_9BACL|nr:ABC transporter ATP-binding protein [Sporolactobacillus shoreicorticis]MCO7127553.1 ABC transporter ATP-binding protein [Sporolactobacillus shoreicorticis]